MNLDKITNIVSYKKFNPKSEDLTNKQEELINKNMDVEVINIWYKSGYLNIHGFIFKKKYLREEVPVILYCRGGRNYKTYSKGELKPTYFYNNKGLLELVREGKVIVFASNYRGSSLSDGVDEYGGDDINDIINMYPIIKKYKFANHKRVCVYGWSRGAMMALLVNKQVDWIKCLIIGGGIYDLKSHKVLRPNAYKMYMKDLSLKIKDLVDRSVVRWVDKLPKKVHMLILHGIDDEISPVEDVYKLENELKKNNMMYKLVIYKNDSHSLYNNINEVAKEVKEWIDIYLL